MAKEHAGGIILATGFRVDNPSPLDDRLVVGTLGDLTSSVTFPNIYPGILVAVSESNYGLFKWNGEDRTNYDNWSAFSGGSISGLGGDADSSLSAISASFASFSISSSFATTSSLAFSSNLATTASHALNTLLATTSSFAITSSFAVTASHVLNSDGTSIDLANLTNSTIFDGNRPISTAQIPGLFSVNPYENAYGFFNEDSSSITDFLEAVFYPPNPNLPPKITSNNQVSIPEFQPSSSFVFDILAQDQQVGNDPTTIDEIVEYRTQSTYTDDFFRIDNPAVGEIKLNTVATTSMNAPGGQHSLGDSHQFYYEVVDARGAFTQETLFIRIIPDSKPSFSTDNDPESGLLRIINEFDPPELFIAQIEGTDEEGPVTFRISSDNNDGFFTIGSSNGIIRLATKSSESMNTDTTRNAYPLDIEIVDQFEQSTLRTFYIRVVPNKAPIFRDGSPTGNIVENSIGVPIFSVNSTPGNKKTIFATNFPSSLPENDFITITTGSNVSNDFDNNFEIVFNNFDLTFPIESEISTITPSITIKQIAQTLNPDLNPTYQLILTASDQHHQSGDDVDSVSHLTVNINITENANPVLDEATQSLSINENSPNGANLGSIAATDPDAAISLNPELIFIDSLQLKGAFFQNGGFPSSNIDTNNYLPNLTESFNGNGLLDPTIDPFEKISNLGIRRKNGVFLNADKINLYEYIVNIGGDVTAGGGAVADTGILQIRILDHEPDDTVFINFDENPFIIESSVEQDTLKVNPNGFEGESAKIKFNSGISHNYEIKSTNNFIQTPLPGDEAIFILDKKISGSEFTRGDIIELEITASQTDFPTTVQKYKYNVNITPNNGPTLSSQTNFSTVHTTVGAIAGENILARINYENPDTEGDLPNFDSFVFDGGGVLEAIHEPLSNRYVIKSLFNLNSGTTYTFNASLEDIHGFSASTTQGSFTITDAGSSNFNPNNDDTHTDDSGISGPLFYILEKVSPGVSHIVVKENNGRPISPPNTQAKLVISYSDPLENETIGITTTVEGAPGNNSIFSITNDGLISAGTNFMAQGYSVGTIKRVDVTYTSNANNPRTEVIFIKITENFSPTIGLEDFGTDYIFPNLDLSSPINIGTTLFTIEGLFGDVQALEGDTIETPTVTIIGFDGNPISNTVTEGDDSVFTITTNEQIITSDPGEGDYNTNFDSNSDGNFVFYVVQGANQGDNVVKETNGVSTGTVANIDVSYTSATSQTINVSFNLADSSGQFATFNQDISVSPPTATFNNFSINNSNFAINQAGEITIATDDFTSQFGDSNLTATVTAVDSNGNSATQDITIIIAQNHAPNLNYNNVEIPIHTSPVPMGTDIIILDEGAISDDQNDDVTVIHDGNTEPNIPGKGSTTAVVLNGLNPIPPPYNTSKIKIQNQGIIFNETPSFNDYNGVITANSTAGGANNIFYILETATLGTPAKQNVNGIVGEQARISAGYGTPPNVNYVYSLTLRDDDGLESNFPGVGDPQFIEVRHSQSVAVEFSIEGISSGIFQIDNDGFISAGSTFANQNYSPGDEIGFSVKVLNSYGHFHNKSIRIIVAENQPPTFVLEKDTTHNFQVPILANTPLYSITNINDPEGDSIISTTITINNPDGTSEFIVSTPNGFPIPYADYANNSPSGHISITNNNSAIILSGQYSITASITDQHGNISEEVFDEFEVLAESEKVLFYKWPETAGNFQLGLSVGAGSTDGTVIGHLSTTTNLAASFDPVFGFNGSAQPTVEFIEEIGLDTMSDGVGNTVIEGTGISQFGNQSYNNETLLIVFPISIDGAPTSMWNENPGDIPAPLTDRYYLWSVTSNFNSVVGSDVVTFTRGSGDGDLYGLLFTKAKQNGSQKIYLVPDTITDEGDLPNS